MFLVLPRDHPLAAKRNLRLADLADEAWIGGRPSCECNRLIYGACARAGYDPRIAFETDDYAAVQGFVAAGVGVSLIAELGPDDHPRRHRRPRPRPRHAGAPDLRGRGRRLPHPGHGGDARGARARSPSATSRVARGSSSSPSRWRAARSAPWPVPWRCSTRWPKGPPGVNALARRIERQPQSSASRLLATLESRRPGRARARAARTGSAPPRRARRPRARAASTSATPPGRSCARWSEETGETATLSVPPQ